MFAVFWQEGFIIIVSEYSMTSDGEARERRAPEAVPPRLLRVSSAPSERHQHARV